MRTNKHGCAPTEDVCMAHHHPLICRHGCQEAGDHRCAGYEAISKVPPDMVRIEPREYLREISANEGAEP